MTKIMQDGKYGDPASWTARGGVRCEKKDKVDREGCRALLDVSANDLVVMYWQGTHSRHYYAAVKCPQCGKYNRVNDVPAPVFEKLDRSNAIFDGFSEAL